MLKQAILYENELKKKYTEAVCDDHFKYFTGISYREFGFKIIDHDWSSIQRVSVNSDNEIIGYIKVDFDRDTRNARGWSLANFTKKPNIIFSRDLLELMRELKNTYNANKFEFSTTVGCEAAKLYIRFIKKYGGTVVGVQKRSQKLIDGKYYDRIMFEVLRENMKF